MGFFRTPEEKLKDSASSYLYYLMGNQGYSHHVELVNDMIVVTTSAAEHSWQDRNCNDAAQGERRKIMSALEGNVTIDPASTSEQLYDHEAHKTMYQELFDALKPAPRDYVPAPAPHATASFHIRISDNGGVEALKATFDALTAQLKTDQKEERKATRRGRFIDRTPEIRAEADATGCGHRAHIEARRTNTGQDNNIGR